MYAHLSPNGKIRIAISANRYMSMESWKVTMTVKAYENAVGQVAFEVYASNINSETVRFLWKDEQHCRIVFYQKDGTGLAFLLTATPEGVVLSPA